MEPDFQKCWQSLVDLSQNQQRLNLSKLFKDSQQREQKFSYELGDLFVDFSKQNVSEDVFQHLIQLAQTAHLDKHIRSLFDCKTVNPSENKAATHHLYRSCSPSDEVAMHKLKMFTLANDYRSGKLKTAFGKKTKHIVNIGIGGSYLGPSLAVNALTDLQTSNTIKVHFLSSTDDSLLQKILQNINIESAVFCLSSKSLSTQETLSNWLKVQNILQNNDKYKPGETHQSLVVATANPEKAKKLGAIDTHIMPFQNTVGGRFSVWSSIGFPLIAAIGESAFQEFLAGANEIDNHFKEAEYKKNLPVLMALYSIWNRSFLNRPSIVYAPYDYRLRELPMWLQQLMMESNGKTGTFHQHTSPVVFGDHGQLSQHSYFQSLHQGTEVIPVEFIGVKSQKYSQKQLLVNMLSQSAALMTGDIRADTDTLSSGNRPSTVIILNRLTPRSLGQMMAMYEHMIFVQSVIWQINCFDQPGVELGKSIAKSMTHALDHNCVETLNLDPSTEQLINKLFND